jgi:putative copper resistance protein D
MSVLSATAPALRQLAPARAPAVVLAVVAAGTTVSSALTDPSHGADSPLLLALLAVRTTTTLAALGTIGSIVLLLCLPGGPSSPAAPAVVRSTAAWAGWWTLLLTGTFAAEALDPATAVAHGGLGPDAGDLDTRLRWLVGGVVLAAATRVLSRSVRGVVDAWILLAVAVAGLVPATVTGHAAGGGSFWLVVGVLMLHVLSVCVWTGGLLGLVMHARGLWAAGVGAQAVGQFSRVALACYIGVVISGVATVFTQSTLDELWQSPAHVTLLAAKVGILAVLGLAGATQRRMVLPHLARRGPALLVLVAAAELVLMATALGLAVTLTHTA